jgi:hypothetical protein
MRSVPFVSVLFSSKVEGARTFSSQVRGFPTVAGSGEPRPEDRIFLGFFPRSSPAAARAADRERFSSKNPHLKNDPHRVSC